MALWCDGSLLGYHPRLVPISLCHSPGQSHGIPASGNRQRLNLTEILDEYDADSALGRCNTWNHYSSWIYDDSDESLKLITTGGSSRFSDHKASFPGWDSERSSMFSILNRYAIEVVTSNDHESVANLVAAVQEQLCLDVLKTLVSKGHGKLSFVDVADVQEFVYRHTFEVLRWKSQERCAIRQTPFDLVLQKMILLAEIVSTIESQLEQNLSGRHNCSKHNPMLDMRNLTPSLIHPSFPRHQPAGHQEQPVLPIPARATPKTSIRSPPNSLARRSRSCINYCSGMIFSALLPVVRADATASPDGTSTAPTNSTSPAVIFMCTVILAVALVVWLASLETGNTGPGIVKRVLERNCMERQVLYTATMVTTIVSLVVVVRMDSHALSPFWVITAYFGLYAAWLYRLSKSYRPATPESSSILLVRMNPGDIEAQHTEQAGDSEVHGSSELLDRMNPGNIEAQHTEQAGDFEVHGSSELLDRMNPGDIEAQHTEQARNSEVHGSSELLGRSRKTRPTREEFVVTCIVALVAPAILTFCVTSESFFVPFLLILAPLSLFFVRCGYPVWEKICQYIGALWTISLNTSR